MKKDIKKEINKYLDEYEAVVLKDRADGYINWDWTNSKTWKGSAYWLLLKAVNRKGLL